MAEPPRVEARPVEVQREHLEAAGVGLPDEGQGTAVPQRRARVPDARGTTLRVVVGRAAVGREDAVPQAVHDRLAAVGLVRLDAVGVVPDDGVGAGIDERACELDAMDGWQGDMLLPPVSDDDDALRTRGAGGEHVALDALAREGSGAGVIGRGVDGRAAGVGVGEDRHLHPGFEDDGVEPGVGLRAHAAARHAQLVEGRDRVADPGGVEVEAVVVRERRDQVATPEGARERTGVTAQVDLAWVADLVAGQRRLEVDHDRAGQRGRDVDVVLGEHVSEERDHVSQRAAGRARTAVSVERACRATPRATYLRLRGSTKSPATVHGRLRAASR